MCFRPATVKNVCPKCGAENIPGANVCFQCGEQLTGSSGAAKPFVAQAGSSTTRPEIAKPQAPVPNAPAAPAVSAAPAAPAVPVAPAAPGKSGVPNASAELSQ